MTLMMHLNQSIVLLYKTCKNLLEKTAWIIDSVTDHSINISKYNPLSGGTYIKLSKELNHPKQV